MVEDLEVEGRLVDTHRESSKGLPLHHVSGLIPHRPRMAGGRADVTVVPGTFHGDAVVTLGSDPMQARLVAIDSASEPFDHQIDCLGRSRPMGMRSNRSSLDTQGCLGPDVLGREVSGIVRHSKLDVDDEFATVSTHTGQTFSGSLDVILVDLTASGDLERRRFLNGHVSLSLASFGVHRPLTLYGRRRPERKGPRSCPDGDLRPWLLALTAPEDGGTFATYHEGNLQMDVNTVVVGFDGSDCSERAVEAAAAVLNQGGEMHLVSAFDAPSAREIKEAYASVPAEFTSSIDLMAGPRSKLTNAAQATRDRGVKVTEHFIDDDPASAILDLADELKADMIVVGSRGLGRASQVVRGSVSTKIAHHARIDFMVIH